MPSYHVPFEAFSHAFVIMLFSDSLIWPRMANSDPRLISVPILALKMQISVMK